MEPCDKKSIKAFNGFGSYLNCVFYMYTVFLAFIILFSLTTSTGVSGKDIRVNEALEGIETNTNNKVSVLAREAYRNFSVDLLREYLEIEEKRDKKASIRGIAPLSVGWMLSVIHEKVWDVPTTGFEHALHLKEDDIHGRYREIVKQLFRDPPIHMHSIVHTSTPDIATPNKTLELNTWLSFLDYNARPDSNHTNEAILQMNSIISKQTYDKISDRLIPFGGWYGTPVSNYTQGVFVNTMHFKSDWLYPFSTAGQKPFGNGQAQFLEATGNFELIKHKSYTAIRLPFKDNGKAMVLIKPRQSLGKTTKNFANEYFNEFLQSMEEKRGNPDSKTTVPITIRVPSFKFSMYYRFPEILANMGISESFCQYKKSGNTLEAFVQAVYGELDEDKLEVAAATGSTLNNVDRFRQYYQLSGIDADYETVHDDSLVKPKAGVAAAKKMLESSKPSKKTSTSRSDRSGNNSASSEKASISSDNRNSTKIVFDTPFLWYLEDDASGLGPLLIGTVESAPNSIDDAKESTPDGFEWLHEVHKFILWSCPDS